MPAASLRILASALAISLAAHADAPAGMPPPPTDNTKSNIVVDGNEAKLMQQQIAAVLLREHVPGAAVVLVDSAGIIWQGGFGESDPVRGMQADPNTPFAAAALSPLVIGLLAARYAALNSDPPPVDPGKPPIPPRAPLEEPLDAAALGIVNPFAPSHPITLATLLEQTSGLEDLSPAELLSSESPNPLIGTVLRIREHNVRWAPGERFVPSRVGLTAAAAQLERWTKKPFASIADTELFQPLGMTQTSYHPDLTELTALALGHRGKHALAWREPLHWPSLGLITTAHDLASLLRFLIARGEAQSGPASGKPLMPKSGVARIERGRSLGFNNIDPPGLGSRSAVDDGYFFAGQSGAYEGGAAELGFFPKERVGYAVLLNAESVEALGAITQSVRRVLLHGAPREPIPPAPEVTTKAIEEDLSRATGVWRKTSVRLEALRLLDDLAGFAVVRRQGSGIAYSASLGPERIFELAGGPGFERGSVCCPLPSFRGPADAHPTIAIFSRPDGDELVTPDGTYSRSSYFAAFGRLVLVAASILGLLSSLLFALIWLPRALFGSLKNSPDLRMRGMPALAALVFFDTLALLVASNQPLGTRNLTTLLLCAMTLVFPGLALASLLEAIRGAPAVPMAMQPGVKSKLPPPDHKARLVRAHALAVSLLACFLSFELLAYGLSGIRTWAI